ncbi:MAG TPA: hypothetical protein VEX43_00320 [Chthoniobacterales bacterium]|nr:hypothetical protein [Chthoniobacterales bacterium]
MKSPRKGSGSAGQTPQLGAFIALCVAVLAVEIAALVIWLPRLRQYGSDVLTFGAYCTFALTAAVVLFGVLKSTGKVHGEQSGVAYEFGGPAALFVLLVVTGITYELKTRPADDFSVPIYFITDDQTSEPIHGKLVLSLDEPKTSSIEAGYSSPQRIPGKWKNVEVRFSVQIEGFTTDDPKPLLRLIPNEQQRVKLRRTGTDKNFSVSIRYDIRTADGIPFGWMYSRENPKGVVAAPISMGQMHARTKLTENGVDDRTAGSLDGAPVASYLVLLTNQAKHPVNLASTNLVVRERKALPKNSVWIWNRKGKVKSEVIEASLSADTTQVKLYPRNDEIAQLLENDVLPLRINLIGVEAGVYDLGIRAEAEYQGSSFVAESAIERLASPKDAVTSDNSLQILSHAPDPELGQSLITLRPDQFAKVTGAFHNQLPRADEVRMFLRDKLAVNLKPASEIEKLFVQTLSASESGLSYLIATRGAAESLPYVRKFLITYPDSDKVRFLEITCLFETGDIAAAKVRSAQLIVEDAGSSWGFYGRWMTGGDLRDLETALRLTPDEENLIGESIERWVVRGGAPTPPIVGRSFSRLNEEAQRRVAETLLYKTLRRDFGLATGPACVQRVIALSPIFADIMALMPQAGFWRMAKPSADRVLPRELQDTVFDLVIRLGRFRLASHYANAWSRTDLVERALWESYDFASLHEIYSTEGYRPKTPDSYIFACLVALDREDFQLFDKLVENNKNVFPNQTDFVHFHYNVIKGKFQDAKQKMGSYMLNSGDFATPAKAGQVFGDIESGSLHSNAGSEWMLHASKKVATATKSYSEIPGFWRLCFGNNDHLLTEWPAEFSIVNRKGGRQVIWLVLSALRETGADVKDLELVRMPLQTCLVLDGKIADGAPTYEGRTLAECRAAIADGALFFDRGVYGRKLTALQVKASHQYSLALYSYWNCGDAGKAILHLDEALKDDPDFYDALVLKIASHASLGDVAESEKIGKRLLAMHLPFPNFGSL